MNLFAELKRRNVFRPAPPTWRWAGSSRRSPRPWRRRLPLREPELVCRTQAPQRLPRCGLCAAMPAALPQYAETVGLGRTQDTRVRETE